MYVTKSLQKFFDISVPNHEKSTNPYKLNKYLDHKTYDQNVINYNTQRTNTLIQSIQFQASGDIPPLRQNRPVRNPNKTQCIETTNDNFIVDPYTINNIHGASKCIPNKIIVPSTKEMYQDSWKLEGLRSSEYKHVENLVNKHQKDGYYSWKSDTLMAPKDRRINNKIQAIIEKKHKFDKNYHDQVKKSIWTLQHTHPRGIVGVDTPLNTESTLYNNKSKMINYNIHKTINTRNRRQKMFYVKNHVNSGILYHEPENFKHELETHSMFGSSKRKLRVYTNTKSRLFDGCGQNNMFKENVDQHYVKLSKPIRFE